MSSNEENSILSNGDILMYHPVIDEEDEDLEDNIIVHDVINNKYIENFDLNITMNGTI